jgi:hypothetical protein
METESYIERRGRAHELKIERQLVKVCDLAVGREKPVP